MFLALASGGMACLTITQTYLIACKYQLGWWLILIGQLLLWTPYDILSKQYGFLILTPVMTWIAYRGLRNHAYLDKQERAKAKSGKSVIKSPNDSLTE